jgi:hypothetical protein
VTVRLDTGSSVTVPEPGWCEGVHAEGEALADLFHEGPEIGLQVETRLGSVEILTASLVEYPHAADLFRRSPAVSVLLADGFHEMGPGELRALATGLMLHADRLRGMALELTRLRGGVR